MKTTRVPVAFALVCVLAAPALSRDFCVQLDEGLYAGSVILLTGVKLGPRQHRPVYGNLRHFSGSAYTDAYPLDGQAMVSWTGNLAIGLSWSLVSCRASGHLTTLFAPAPNQTIKLACLAGPDGRVGILDSCPNAFVLNGEAASHVVPCNILPPLP